jgi:CheY-like chemotaxis protein
MGAGQRRGHRPLRQRAGAGRIRSRSRSIAHRHHWLLGQLTAQARQPGTEVVTATSNGADALGAIIAEQPDIAVLGDTLEMITVWEVLAEARAHAVHCPDRCGGQRQPGWRDAASATTGPPPLWIFGDRYPPIGMVSRMSICS